MSVRKELKGSVYEKYSFRFELSCQPDYNKMQLRLILGDHLFNLCVCFWCPFLGKFHVVLDNQPFLTRNVSRVSNHENKMTVFFIT